MRNNLEVISKNIFEQAIEEGLDEALDEISIKEALEFNLKTKKLLEKILEGLDFPTLEKNLKIFEDDTHAGELGGGLHISNIGNAANAIDSAYKAFRLLIKHKQLKNLQGAAELTQHLGDFISHSAQIAQDIHRHHTALDKMEKRKENRRKNRKAAMDKLAAQREPN